MCILPSFHFRDNDDGYACSACQVSELEKLLLKVYAMFTGYCVAGCNFSCLAAPLVGGQTSQVDVNKSFSLTLTVGLYCLFTSQILLSAILLVLEAGE